MMNGKIYRMMPKKVFSHLFLLFLFLLMVSFTSAQPEIEVVPDFAGIKDPARRKALFFDFMRPIVEEENARIRIQRDRLLRLRQKYINGTWIAFWDKERFKEVCREYKVDCSDPPSEEVWDKLDLRINEVPIRLALAQSASESAWGASRFAVTGNAMFGQWTYSESNGMVPNNRSPEDTYKVAEFDNVKQSVRSYMRNLNTHRAYREFRELRRELRRRGMKPDGYTLANELVRYSERRHAYVNEIKQIIENNSELMRIR